MRGILITQAELARRLGVTPLTISNWKAKGMIPVEVQALSGWSLFDYVQVLKSLENLRSVGSNSELDH